eukprot:1922552-Prymnesium_polylepis.3
MDTQTPGPFTRADPLATTRLSCTAPSGRRHVSGRLRRSVTRAALRHYCCTWPTSTHPHIAAARGRRAPSVCTDRYVGRICYTHLSCVALRVLWAATQRRPVCASGQRVRHVPPHGMEQLPRQRFWGVAVLRRARATPPGEARGLREAPGLTEGAAPPPTTDASRPAILSHEKTSSIKTFGFGAGRVAE